MKILLPRISMFTFLGIFVVTTGFIRSWPTALERVPSNEIIGRNDPQIFRPAPMQSKFNRTFEGTLDNKIKIQMKLVRDGDDLSGSYFYEKYRKDITLSGDIDASGYFKITEYDVKNAENGTFYGAFIGDEAMVGFWNSESSPDRRLTFQLVESGKQAGALITESNRPAKVECEVKDDYGSLSILMIGDTIVGLGYDNVGGNAHTCSLYVDRREKGVVWEDRSPTTKISFTKEYFNDEQSAEVVIKKIARGYDLTFSGDLSYFCGVRAILPPRVSVYKSGKVWVGKAR